MSDKRGAFRILLVDDHPVFREGVRSVIDSHPRFQVAAEAGNVREALEKLPLCTPDMVITDLRMGLESGRDLVRLILVDYPTMPILVLSKVTDPQQVLLCIEAGAKGYVTKGASREALLLAIQDVAEGKCHVCAEVAHALFEKVRIPVAADRQHDFDLTGRERDTLDGLCQGLTAQEIGQRLFLSPATIKTYMRGLFRKLGVSSRAQLVLKALELKLVVLQAGPDPSI